MMYKCTVVVVSAAAVAAAVAVVVVVVIVVVIVVYTQSSKQKYQNPPFHDVQKNSGITQSDNAQESKIPVGKCVETERAQDRHTIHTVFRQAVSPDLNPATQHPYTPGGAPSARSTVSELIHFLWYPRNPLNTTSANLEKTTDH